MTGVQGYTITLDFVSVKDSFRPVSSLGQDLSIASGRFEIAVNPIAAAVLLFDDILL